MNVAAAVVEQISFNERVACKIAGGDINNRVRANRAGRKCAPAAIVGIALGLKQHTSPGMDIARDIEYHCTRAADLPPIGADEPIEESIHRDAVRVHVHNRATSSSAAARTVISI